MEALSSGSSANFRASTAGAQYEPVSEALGDLYEEAHVCVPDHTHREAEEVRIVEYEEPDLNIVPQTQAHPHQNQYLQLSTLPEEHTYTGLQPQAQQRFNRYSPSRSPVQHRSPSRITVKPAETHVPTGQWTTITENDCYESLDYASARTYENTSLLKPPPIPGPRKSSSVPDELSSLSEITVEDIPGSNLSQNEAQLWTLNQMQKLVQKLEGMYEQIAVGAYTGRPENVPAPPGQDIEEIYDEIDDQVPIQAIVSPSSSSKPPIPPRTYSCRVKNTPSANTQPIEELRHRLKTGVFPGFGAVSTAKVKRQHNMQESGHHPRPKSTYDPTCESRHDLYSILQHQHCMC